MRFRRSQPRRTGDRASSAPLRGWPASSGDRKRVPAASDRVRSSVRARRDGQEVPRAAPRNCRTRGGVDAGQRAVLAAREQRTRREAGHAGAAGRRSRSSALAAGARRAPRPRPQRSEARRLPTSTMPRRSTRRTVQVEIGVGQVPRLARAWRRRAPSPCPHRRRREDPRPGKRQSPRSRVGIDGERHRGPCSARSPAVQARASRARRLLCPPGAMVPARIVVAARQLADDAKRVACDGRRRWSSRFGHQRRRLDQRHGTELRSLARPRERGLHRVPELADGGVPHRWIRAAWRVSARRRARR